MQKPVLSFETLLRGLNPAQKEAVEAIEGPVMVVAGPGTGKTHILTLRIANILKKTDTPPDGILALTFTEAAAANMRKRLADIVGTAGYRVRIHTFHGYCQDVISRYPDEFPRIIGSEPISDVERIDIIRKIIEKGDWEQVRTFGSPFFFLQDILKSISEVKRENILPAAFKEFIGREREAFDALPDLYHEKGPHKGKMKGEHQRTDKLLKRSAELAEVFDQYEKEMRKRMKYDFDDMIVEVVGAIERDKNLLLRLQEESLYILADEHQDANAAQNRLLELLSGFHEQPNLFVVGDEKQAIYRFQGASLENFAYFQRLFPGAKLITLTESYRSGQEILDASHSLVSASGTHAELVSKANISSAIELRAFPNAEMERTWIAKDVKRLIDEGVEASSVAVLFRTNREADPMRLALEGQGVTASIESGENALHDPEIRRLITLLYSIARLGDSEALLPLIHINFVWPYPVDAYKISRYAREKEIAITDLLASEAYLKAASVSHVKEALALHASLHAWAMSEGSVPRIIERVIRESGFLAYALGTEHPIELLEKIGWFIRDIETLSAGKPDYSLSQLAADLDLLEEHGVSVSKEKRAAPRAGAVRLMTSHRAKGLEFEFVYIANVTDGVWGGRKSQQFFMLPQAGVTGGDEDERRLLYVALTRGKLSVAVSYSVAAEGGRERLRSRLLEDIKPALIKEMPVDDFVGSYRPLAALSKPVRASAPEAEYLRELFDQQGLSVTALNNYLKCPWEYFYNNLVRIPVTPTKEMMFGTAAHAALRKLFNCREEGKEVSAALLVKWFDEALARLPLSRKELAEVQERGEKFLTGWYAEAAARFPKTTKTEYKIQTSLKFEGDGAVILRGILDRIDLENDKAWVADYKTGKPKTRNAILGLTQDETGPAYFRQLVFYRLLLDLDGRYSFRGAHLDFLQPDERGKYHCEQFEIPDEELVLLKGTIERVSNEIRDLAFWNATCDDKDCEFCALRRLMK
ncbi:MAG: UvrD/REP helicase, helicase / ATP-dependent helicase PcrA [Candidatus Kaiserbacteria bacterium]|nr:UvrD/REP helicase, helicase / ATP-dependent helicase PcrA [Candidatus Kaiserbacteria bacterium]